MDLPELQCWLESKQITTTEKTLLTEFPKLINSKARFTFFVCLTVKAWHTGSLIRSFSLWCRLELIEAFEEKQQGRRHASEALAFGNKV